MNQTTPPSSIRIDKWLWAARFFKTRSQAKQAVEGGKIHVDGQRTKASKEIKQGMSLSIRQGWDEKEIIVDELSLQRRGAPEAQKLYTETPQSIETRKRKAAERKASGITTHFPYGKPNAKQRKQIHAFKRIILEEDSP